MDAHVADAYAQNQYTAVRSLRNRSASSDARRAMRVERYSPSGCRQRNPGNRAKSRSVVTHSAPDSIASAA